MVSSGWKRDDRRRRDNPTTRFIGLRMAGDAIDETDAQGNAITDCYRRIKRIHIVGINGPTPKLHDLTL